MEKQTVIGIFDYGIDAQMAAQKLMKSGIPDNNIDLFVNGAHERTGNTTGTNTLATDRNRDNDETDNFFGSLFGDSDESTKYAEVARHGAVLTVHAQSEEEAKRAAELLDQCGAIDVDKRAEQYRSMPQENRADWIKSNSSIPVIEEEMEVGKREVETGGVRLRSRIVERPVEEHLRLREEHINVERRAVNRPASEQDFAAFKEGETTIIEHAEVPVVNKEARVVEEVSLNKETESRDETVRGTVRKTDVEIDDLDETNERRNQRPGGQSTL
ncbi:YsnF/AvaK domain-containing protein [Pontibacter sp. 172403-2]|uniref:YsnF/AvaK domain-containing protein n=1 Tax=Pontibacter rufus TaxID=2791028 RepID=UPI0018B00F45|nr:YsnF/AvaK domain-containing protein [Pontibacter sp. 172403-2]MBF9254363.1 YsnF/AvaK domain-containing protein [Pontibacter sp. 172403-2]